MNYLSNFYKMKRKKDLLYRKNILNKMNKINEFRVCDCFLDSNLSFERKCESIDNIDDMKKGFDDATTNCLVEENVYSVFDVISIVCCETALQQFDFEKRILLSNEQLHFECCAHDIECHCALFLEEKTIDFEALCIKYQFNFLKMISSRLIKIKT